MVQNTSRTRAYYNNKTYKTTIIAIIIYIQKNNIKKTLNKQTNKSTTNENNNNYTKKNIQKRKKNITQHTKRKEPEELQYYARTSTFKTTLKGTNGEYFMYDQQKN